MSDTNSALMRQMLEWIDHRPREYLEVMEAWRTSCPRLSIWEDACIDGLVARDPVTGRITVTAKGAKLLLHDKPAAHSRMTNGAR